jgi:carbon monoxide dehydrogenase subunit G
MTRIENSIQLPAPIEEAFQYASDYKEWEEWFEGVSDFKPTTNTIKGNGTRYSYKAKMMGLSVNIETEIFDYVENKGWKGRATKGMPHTTFWVFETVDGGTKFTYALEYNIYIPLFGKWLDKKFIKPQWERIIGNSLKNLKEHFI